MRVAIASIHPRMLSGQIDALVGLARELREIGHTVEMVSAFAETDLLAGDRTNGGPSDQGTLLPKLARIWRIVRNLERAAAGADVVHFNLPTAAFSILGDLLHTRTATPVVVGYEAHMAGVRELLGAGRLFQAPAFYLPRLVVNNRVTTGLAAFRCARYVVSSQLQRHELQRFGVPDAKIEVVPNLIDRRKLAEPPGQIEARWRLGLPIDGDLVVYVGHYNHVKGVDVLVEAFPRVLRERPGARLVLAWSGLGPDEPVRRAIERHGLGERVIQLGKVDVGQLLSAASVVALPYRMTIGQAAFPGLVLETMQVGVPLVTSRLPLLAELLEDGGTALLAEPENPASLGDGVVNLLSDARLRAAMVAAQRRTMAGPLHPRALAERYVRVYERATGRQATVLQPGRGEPVLRSVTVRQPERRAG